MLFAREVDDRLASLVKKLEQATKDGADKRLQTLMDRNNSGQLTPDEREEFQALADLSETISLVRADALHLLGFDDDAELPGASFEFDFVEVGSSGRHTFEGK